jgi:ribose transport system permease protein
MSVGTMDRAAPQHRRSRKGLSQHYIVFLMVVGLFAVFAVTLPAFRSSDNLVTLLRNICVLGILGIGMGVVVIARGIDLSQVVIMAVSSAYAVRLMSHHGMGEAPALLLGLVVAVVLGLVNGFLIAFVEIPALFATLATYLLFFNGARTAVLPSLVEDVPGKATHLLWLGHGSVLGIPVPILVFAVVALLTEWGLTRTSVGRFIYAHGDNPEGAGITGIPTRPLTMLEYAFSALVAYVAGLVQTGSIASMDTHLALGNLIFSVILVVVLGGISLVGGRGGVHSVIVGALLVGVMVNGMTLMNLANDVQGIVLGLVLLGAILLDNRLHPRDEETVKQGD